MTTMRRTRSEATPVRALRVVRTHECHNMAALTELSSELLRSTHTAEHEGGVETPSRELLFICAVITRCAMTAPLTVALQ